MNSCLLIAVQTGRIETHTYGKMFPKLAVTQGSTIALNVLVMNLEKLLELLFVFFTGLLCLLLVKEGGRSIRTVPLKPQIAAA